MRKLAVLAFCAASFFPACSQEVKTAHRPNFQACLVDQPKNNINASFCNNRTGERISVTSDSIVFVSSDGHGVREEVAISLTKQVLDHGKIIAADIDADVVYFLTENGTLFRYAREETVPLRMADKHLDLDPNKVSLEIRTDGTDEIIALYGTSTSYSARYDRSEEAFFFQVN